MKKKLSIWLLEQAEKFFLKAHGFVRQVDSFGQSSWGAPENYPFRRQTYLSHSHAVNSLKQTIYNPHHGGTRRRDYN